jgi:hypothetical protein
MLDTRFRFADFLRFLFAYPLFLIRGPRLKARVHIRALPSTVFPLVNDLKNWPRWMATNPRDKAVNFVHGTRNSGQDSELSWSSPAISGSVLMIVSTRGRHAEYELEMGPGTGAPTPNASVHRARVRFDCSTEGDFTRLSWRCTWEPTVHPIVRTKDLFWLWKLKREFTRGFDQIKMLAETALPRSA